ncbi:hypothetical protein [Gudongella sp. DL1XJH-153]|uniref:hypothetical protein n=1 Tax=Gudongella sp. DL1XJH-153 TaxID=3409804 RepID=UPI003BB56166
MFTLGRKIDIHYPTNRWIIVIAILATGGSFSLTRDISIAWRTGASIFLTWALTRELDPKRKYAAFASAFFALSSLFVAFEVDLMAIFFLLLMMRFVNKITGDINTILDMAALLGLAAALSYNSETSIYLLLLLIGIFFNLRNTNDKKKNIIFLLFTAVIFTGQFLVTGGYGLSESDFSKGWIRIIYLVSVAFYLVYVLMDKEKSTLGDNGEMVEAKKILSAQLYFAIGISILMFFSKVPSGNVIVYMSSMLGYLIYGIMTSFIFPLLPNK